MIVKLRTQGLQIFEDIRAFVAGSQAADFEGVDRADAYRLVSDTLRRFGYRRCSRPNKGVLRRYLMTVTGLSRAQIRSGRLSGFKWRPEPAHHPGLQS